MLLLALCHKEYLLGEHHNHLPIKPSFLWRTTTKPQPSHTPTLTSPTPILTPYPLKTRNPRHPSLLRFTNLTLTYKGIPLAFSHTQTEKNIALIILNPRDNIYWNSKNCHVISGNIGKMRLNLQGIKRASFSLQAFLCCKLSPRSVSSRIPT